MLQLKSNKSSIDMAKIQIKSEKLTPFGGIFAIMEQFYALLSKTIDSTLGLRSKVCGYQYSEIFRFLMCVYFCSGLCVEDVTTHLMKHLSLHPTLPCSADNHTASYRGTDCWQHDIHINFRQTIRLQYDRHNEQTVDQRLACNRTTNALIGVS